MKIQSDRSLPVSGEHLKSPARRLEKPKKLGEKDSVELSSRADEVRRLTELTKLTPDMRLDKVSAIKKQIAAGTYKVPADSVARSIAGLHKKLKRDDG